jgi:hypothetical protein
MCTAFGGAFIPTILLLIASPPLAAQPTTAGRVKVATGSVYIVRDNASIRAQIGQTVFEADRLKTGNDGTIGVTLKDDTRLSLGPNSELILKRVVYAPAEGGLGLVIQFVRGVSAYVSGQIAKLAPDSVRLETPTAIVGVRGTTLAIRAEQ